MASKHKGVLASFPFFVWLLLSFAEIALRERVSISFERRLGAP